MKSLSSKETKNRPNRLDDRATERTTGYCCFGWLGAKIPVLVFDNKLTAPTDLVPLVIRPSKAGDDCRDKTIEKTILRAFTTTLKDSGFYGQTVPIFLVLPR
jgi:hypothetical protein